jgi:23S rRNA (cytidine1920-2'-O)/16S rRNA (cytidine1409-2'-O)-methyltransferase
LNHTRADVFLNFEENSVDKLPRCFYECDDYCARISLHTLVCEIPYSAEMKVRLDKLVFERGLTSSRERAQALILAGRVLVNEQKVEKPGTAVVDDAAIRILGDDVRYVSRGGLKLEHALKHWKVELARKNCLDIGASTGGFTDCMLQHGAAHVIAVDTGYGQIHSRLREDQRVELLENTNARYLTEEQLSLSVDFIAFDVSFISVTLVLPAVMGAVRARTRTHFGGVESVILVKPQFEVGRESVGKGGIVRDEAAQRAAVDRVEQAVRALNGTDMDVIESPITGAEGNREFLLHAWV